VAASLSPETNFIMTDYPDTFVMKSLHPESVLTVCKYKVREVINKYNLSPDYITSQKRGERMLRVNYQGLGEHAEIPP
jgi:hypothetical protein